MNNYKVGDTIKTKFGTGRVVEIVDVNNKNIRYAMELEKPENGLNFTVISENEIKGLWKDPIDKLKEKGFKVVMKTKDALDLERVDESQGKYFLRFRKQTEALGGEFILAIKEVVDQSELNLVLQLLKDLNKGR